LTILSRPHPGAFNLALAMPDGEQAHRSAHHKWFLEPDAGARVLADDVRWLRERHQRNGVPEAATERHVAVIGNTAAMEGALAWYRARGTHHKPVGKTVVPTLYIWGDADDTVGRAAAEGTGEFVSAPNRPGLFAATWNSRKGSRSGAATQVLNPRSAAASSTSCPGSSADSGFVWVALGWAGAVFGFAAGAAGARWGAGLAAGLAAATEDFGAAGRLRKSFAPKSW
jgi:hypothetical protein